MPQRICASHLEKEPPHQHNLTKLIVRHPPTACPGPAQRQDRSSSLRCGRSVLTPALTQCCLHGARKPAKPLLNNLLTHPAPSGMTVPSTPPAPTIWNRPRPRNSASTPTTPLSQRCRCRTHLRDPTRGTAFCGVGHVSRVPGHALFGE